MEAMFFGPDAHALYGVYHPPTRTRVRESGVVLCYPAGQEYIRIHRAYRWLADQLAASGFHVLRFDYSGQGDSCGAFGDARVSQWMADIGLAVEELRGSIGVECIDLVGLRLGALLAAAVAPHNAVRRVVLWEPRANGAVLHRELLGDDPSATIPDDAGLVPRHGFAYAPAFLGELAAFDATHHLGVATARRVEKLLVVNAEPVEGLDPILARYRAAGTVVEECLVDSPTNWNSIDDMGGLFLPMPSMQCIAGWLDADR